MNVPQLELKLYKNIHTIYEGALSVYAKSGSTQSFFELSENISNMESFLECMEDCHKFIAEHGGKLKSTAELLDDVLSQERISDANLRLLIEKVEVFQGEDKGVDVKIVFNGNFGVA